MLVGVRHGRWSMNTVEVKSALTELEAEKRGLWTTKEVATFLRVSRSWVYHQAEAGLIPCLRVGSLLRYEPDSIRQFARGEWKPANLIDLPKKGRG
ncbi:MAG TPA: helix-turn-helix domain-containing protein [Polyangia bacterium]|nr:helix-turn-helix domain-containing protein [Polyangia bacterium]